MLIRLNELVPKYNIKLKGVLHIGAHMCEELKDYQKYGMDNKTIIWVEANPNLVIQNYKIDKTRVVKNYICCDKDGGYTRLNISNNGQSSSILELGTHRISYPAIHYVAHANVLNKRIDTMYKEDNIPEDFANFLNIDIQGAELLALKGMGNLLHKFDYIYLEVNRIPVYQKCAMVNEIDDHLKQFNFKRVQTKWTNEGWGDAFYIKN